MKTPLPCLSWALALTCAMPIGLAWGQSAPVPAHVQAAQQKLQMVDISAEQRLAALRQSLLKTAMEGPTEVKSTQWIDHTGALRESSSFTSGMLVRGVRVLTDPTPAGVDKVQAKEKQAVVEKACERTGQPLAPCHTRCGGVSPLEPC